MASVIRPTTAADEEPLIEFLTRVFNLDRSASFVQPALLRWKYWDPRPDWSEPRSFVMDKDGRIVAHAGVWPVTVRTNGIVERGMHMMDWASSPEAPGAGVSLLQRLTKTHDFVYAIGGTDMTQSILPKFGFKAVANASTFARPIRPWRQILRHPARDARLPVRFIRNTWWSMSPGRVAESGWEAREAAADDIAALSTVCKERDSSFFHYVMQCPAARFSVFLLLNHRKPCGCVLLSVVRDQARIAGLWLNDERPEAWRIGFQLAQDVALRYTDACEVTARIAGEPAATGARQAGLRYRGHNPAFLYRKGANTALPVKFQLVDNDSVFLGGDQQSFET